LARPLATQHALAVELCEVVGHEEGLDVLLKLSMRSVVVAFDGGLFERAVHPFDLAVGPRVIGLREPVLDVVFVANAVEHVASPQGRRPHAILWQIGELDTVVSEHGVDFVRNGFDKGFEEVRAVPKEDPVEASLPRRSGILQA
jgi:hypothetical protein